MNGIVIHIKSLIFFAEISDFGLKSAFIALKACFTARISFARAEEKLNKRNGSTAFTACSNIIKHRAALAEQLKLNKLNLCARFGGDFRLHGEIAGTVRSGSVIHNNG